MAFFVFSVVQFEVVIHDLCLFLSTAFEIILALHLPMESCVTYSEEHKKMTCFL